MITIIPSPTSEQALSPILEIPSYLDTLHLIQQQI